MKFCAPIVEGQGEIGAVQALIYRVAQAKGIYDVVINNPQRVRADRFLKWGEEFHKHLALAAHRARKHNGFVLILLDCDDGCPAELGPEILQRAEELIQDVPILVSLAKREFECWFIASIESLHGEVGIRMDVTAPATPEAIRNAKGSISQVMDRAYDPILHQSVLAKRFDLDLAARRSPSFSRFRQRLLEHLA
ncbi:MAG: DUF4276 family protein [Rhodothalassiaceae bacterium]